MTALLSLAMIALASPVLDSANADRTLKPGDVLVKFLGPTTKISKTEIAIEGGQKATRRLAGIFHKELKKGDAKSFHVAIYLGHGQTAEAHGGDLKTAHVGLRKIDDHAGYFFQVYRPKDSSLAQSAAHVAELWARPNRMKYAVPLTVPLHLSSFGSEAKKQALDYGRSADREGGPADVAKMFCSEFVIAAYQGAVVKSELSRSSALSADKVTMPTAVKLQAAHASPLAPTSTRREVGALPHSLSRAPGGTSAVLCKDIIQPPSG
jgi:hypothetical protein